MYTSQFPTISFEDLVNLKASEALDAACRDWGIFLLKNHPIPPTDCTRLRTASNRFFSQRLEIKRQIERSESNPWGFYNQELTKNTQDWKEIFDYGPEDSAGWKPQWPGGLPEFQEVVTAHWRACEAVAFQLLECIAHNLGASADALQQGFKPSHTSFLRLNYYPPCASPEAPAGMSTPTDGHLGVNHHTDSGAITLLLQDNHEGLEIYRQGRWHRVPADPELLVVNIGDIVQVWSNDRYLAPVHRVRANKSQQRLSAPFFFNPRYDYVYEPLQSSLASSRPPRYRAIKWGEFRRLRALGDYGDYGSEVQISDYSTGS
ncbi:MAG: 2OG-Fe(II) oxygenase family protein [Pseudomonadota bacterium]